MISICTQFYDKDYDKLGNFIDSVFKSIKCRCEIIIFDNRNDRSEDVYNKYVEKYMDSCVIKYINDGFTVDVLSARRKLVNAASGDYVWFTNVSDELSGIITTRLFEHSCPDIVAFSGYDEQNDIKVGPVYTSFMNLNPQLLDQRYLELSNQVFGLWSFWFKTSFIKELFNTCLKMNSSYIENVLLKSVAISKAKNIFISPEVFYIKKSKDEEDNPTTFNRINFEVIFTEVEQAKSLYKDNKIVMKILQDDRFIQEYAQKLINRFNGTDQELLDLSKRFMEFFELDKDGIEKIIASVDESEYDFFNLFRLKALCNLKNGSKLVDENKGLVKLSSTGKYVCSVRGFRNYRYINASLTICITCYDGDYDKAIDLIKTIKSNPFLKNVEVLVINNCVEQTLEKEDGVKYVDTHENLYSYKSRLLGAETADTEYIWFVDGDDEVCIDFNILDFLSNENSDMVNFSKERIVNFDFPNRESMCFYFLNTGLDTSLHTTFFSKKVYKKFCDLPKITVYLGDDVFLNTFGMLNSDTLSVCEDVNVYRYKSNTHYLKPGFYTGYKDICNLAKEMFPYKIYKRYVDLVSSYIFDRVTPEEFKTLNVANDFPYIINSDEKNFDDLDLESTNGVVDIIYVYYGTDLKAELENLDKMVLCKHNVTIVDLLGDYKGELPVIHKESFYDSITEAFSCVTSNHVWILESYKKIHKFTGVHLNEQTTYFRNEKKGDFNPLARNNVIFLRSDFEEFLKNNKSLNFGELSTYVFDYVMGKGAILCKSTLVDADLFDEKEITFIFIGTDGFLERSKIAQLCVNDLKEKFPDSNIIIHDEESLKSLIAQSKITQDIIALRSKTLEYRNFENDILRLMAIQSTKKSIYIDMDIMVTNKERLLKDLSTYPTFCQYDVNYQPMIFNEFMWSLNGSSFIQENINFYDSVTVEQICNKDQPLYNSAVAKRLMGKFGGTSYSGIFKILDLYSTSVRDDDVQFHFRTSRYQYFGDKKDIKIGIMEFKYSTDINIASFVDENNLDALYIMTDWRILDKYHVDVNGCEVTSTGIYQSIDKTVELLKENIENSGITIKDIFYYN